MKVDGLVNKPAEYELDDLIKDIALEERIYRMRCVEGWSMVIPWVGLPLASVLEAPRAARQRQVRRLRDAGAIPRRCPGQRGDVQPLPWPYVEGLRIDEAMHPLAILAVGLYGETLPNQNGAPIRLVVPWKYGFKGIKSIVQNQPHREAAADAPGTCRTRREYGFYSNVNPDGRPPALEPGHRAPHRRERIVS